MTQQQAPKSMILTPDTVIHGSEEYLYERRRELVGGKPPVQVSQHNVGWSKTGQLFTRNSLLNPTPPVAIQLQVSFEQQMQTHTVQFNAPDNNIFLASAGIITEAEILWSVEGNTVRRVVTVSDGMAVSGEAQAVTVNIYDVSQTNFVRNYDVGVTVAPGVRGSTGQPPQLRVNGTNLTTGLTFPYFFLLFPGEIVEYLIPPNVGAISSFTTVTCQDPGAVQLFDQDVKVTHRTVGGEVQQIYGYDGCFKYIPLFGVTKSVQIANHTAANNILVSNHLGIEG